MKDLVNISVAVAGNAEGAVDWSFRLWAPQSEGFFRTDFPLVEGTELIDMAVRAPDGKLAWNYAFPIRGIYRLELKAVDADGTAVARTVLLEVNEDWTKWVFLLTFLVLLFILGVFAGRVFTRERSWSTQLLLGLLGSLMLSSGADAVADLESKIVITPPRVGSLSTIEWSVTDPGLSRVEDVLLTLKVTQLEKNRTLFGLSRLPSQGHFKFDYQFTDASPHRIDVVAVLDSGEEIVATTQTVQVTSPDPTLEDRLRPVILSVLVVMAGLMTGRLSRRRAARKSLYIR